MLGFSGQQSQIINDACRFQYNLVVGMVIWMRKYQKQVGARGHKLSGCFANLCDQLFRLALKWTLNICRFVFSCRVLIRPHPAIWRLVHGLAIVYLVALTFLLFQVGFLFVKTTSLSCTRVLSCCLHLHILASPDFSFVKLTFLAHLHIHNLVLCLYIHVHACLCKAIFHKSFTWD